MISVELHQSLKALQIAALERLAQRDGVFTTRHELSRLVEQGGIAHANAEMRRSKPQPRPQQEVREPVQATPSVSFFRRLSQRWFGRG